MAVARYRHPCVTSTDGPSGAQWMSGTGEPPVVESPFGGGGQVGRDEGEVGQTGRGAPGAAGGALLDLGRADVALALIVGEGHGEVDHEAQDHLFVVAEPLREGERIVGEWPGAGGVVADPGVQGAAVAAADVSAGVGIEVVETGGAGRWCALVGIGEGVGHRRGPELGRRGRRGGTAARSRRDGLRTRRDGRRPDGRSRRSRRARSCRCSRAAPSGVDVGLGPPAGVHRGQELGRGDVDVLQGALGAGRGLIDVQHPDCAQQLAGPGAGS